MPKAKGSKRSGTRLATDEEIDRLNQIERLRIEVALKAANLPIIVNPNDDFLISVEYQWHKHKGGEWHCKHKNLPMEFVNRDEYDLFTGEKI